MFAIHMTDKLLKAIIKRVLKIDKEKTTNYFKNCATNTNRWITDQQIQISNKIRITQNMHVKLGQNLAFSKSMHIRAVLKSDGNFYYEKTMCGFPKFL